MEQLEMYMWVIKNVWKLLILILPPKVRCIKIEKTWIGLGIERPSLTFIGMTIALLKGSIGIKTKTVGSPSQTIQHAAAAAIDVQLATRPQISRNLKGRYHRIADFSCVFSTEIQVESVLTHISHLCETVPLEVQPYRGMFHALFRLQP